MRYREATPIQRFLRWSAATTPVSWIYVRVLHHLDRLSCRLTRGRHTFSSWLSGLPVVMLTTTGARTGQQRRVPVIAVPDGKDLVVIASNWGQRQHPAWYYNLRAHPQATVTVGGVSRRVRGHEATGEERTAYGSGTWRSIRGEAPMRGVPPIGPSPWWCWLRCGTSRADLGNPRCRRDERTSIGSPSLI